MTLSLSARLLGGLLSAGLWLHARLPQPLRRGIVGLAQHIYLAAAGDTRQTIITNLQHVNAGLQAQGIEVGDAEAFAERCMKATVQLVDETALCWRGPPHAWRRLLGRIHGEDAVALLTATHARFADRDNPSASDAPAPGVLLLSPHLGNWELLNMYLGSEFGLTVLYDPPKIAALDPLIRASRERNRSTVLPIGPAGLRGMVARLRRGGVVGLLPDQVPDLSAGVLADFFGKQALTINLVHRLAERHQTRVFLVCALRNAEGRFDIHFDELTAGVRDCTEQEAALAMNQAIERQIALAPEQYQWSYKRFKRVDPQRPNIYREAQGR